MIAALLVVGLCLVASVALVLLSAPLVQRARPSTAVPLLAIGSLVSAVSLGVLLSLLGVAVLGRVPVVASAAGWSSDLLAADVPVPAAIGVGAGIAAAVLLSRAVYRTAAIAVLLTRADRLGRRLRGSGPPIVMVDESVVEADAFTLAGVRGCVVISRRLFSGLGPVERQMLTGHELSHLRRRHHLYVHATDLAVAANPLLARVAGAVRFGIERWADEDAAGVMSDDRSVAAAALAKTALIRAALRRGADRQDRATARVFLLAAAASHVPQRVRALLTPAPPRSAIGAGLAVLLLGTCAAAAATALHLHAGFEQAEMLRQVGAH